MTSFKRAGTNKEDGFTLIELLVVILIIGILAAIAIPAFLNQRKEASLASLKSDLHNVSTAMETELVKNKGLYPSAIPSSFKTSDGVNLSIANAVDPNAPIDPLTKQGWIKVPLSSSNPSSPDTYVYFQVQGAYLKAGYKGPWITQNDTLYTFGYEGACSDGTKKKGSVNHYKMTNNPSFIEGYMTNCPIPSTATSLTITKHPTVIGGYQPVSTVVIYPAGSPENNKPVTPSDSYCINGYHESEPSKIWHYDSNNGGLREGKCA